MFSVGLVQDPLYVSPGRSDVPWHRGARASIEAMKSSKCRAIGFRPESANRGSAAGSIKPCLRLGPLCFPDRYAIRWLDGFVCRPDLLPSSAIFVDIHDYIFF